MGEVKCLAIQGVKYPSQAGLVTLLSSDSLEKRRVGGVGGGARGMWGWPGEEKGAG